MAGRRRRRPSWPLMLAASPRLRRDRSYSASKSVEFRLEIGCTPRRDRFISAARSVVFRVEIGRAAAGLLFADGSGVRYVVFAPRACRACLDVGSAELKWTDLEAEVDRSRCGAWGVTASGAASRWCGATGGCGCLRCCTWETGASAGRGLIFVEIVGFFGDHCAWRSGSHVR